MSEWTPTRWEKSGTNTQIRNVVGYVIINGSRFLNKSGEWEYEPMPSADQLKRDGFMKRTRFNDSQQAIEAANKVEGK